MILRGCWPGCIEPALLSKSRVPLSLKSCARPRVRLRRLVAAVLAAAAGPLLAQEFVVKDIRVEGAQRTEAGTIFSYLPIRVGDRFDPDKGVNAIRALFATGLFKDVRLEVDGDTLVVIVEERPSIAQVELSGVKEFDKDDGQEVIARRRPRRSACVRPFAARARRAGAQAAIPGARPVLRADQDDRDADRAQPGQCLDRSRRRRRRAHQARCASPATRHFPTATLRGQIELSTEGWFTWYTKRDQYSRQKLTADLESLRSYYLNRGYLDFKVDSTQVSISPGQATTSTSRST